MSVYPVGPIFTGGFEEIVSADGLYRILYLPDKHNDELQREGKPPVYYWVPAQVRIAKKGDIGDYKFNLLHFVGVRSEGSHVGVEGNQEVAGGVFSVTVTASPPLEVLKKSHEQVLERFRGKDQRYWGWRSPVEPQFAPVPISDSQVVISNLSPESDGSVPAATTTETVAPAAAGPGSATTVPVPSGAPAAPRGGDGVVPPELRIIKVPRTVPLAPAFRDFSNLDSWFVKMQGQGPGSIDPAAEHAFTALLGSLPTAILWQGFHGIYSPISVSVGMKLKLWSQNIRLKLGGNWDSIFQHFSANANGRKWWFSADIKAEFNKLWISGGIEVELEIDGTIPGADKFREEITKRMDLVIEKFMEQAKQRIFDPAPPQVEPAQASTGGFLSGLFGGGGSSALKYRRDETKLDLHYDETRSERYVHTHVISGTLEGFYEEIKKDPDAEKKYFRTLYLDDWDKLVARIVKPVVNWPDPAKKWVGEPVSFLSCQIGYPDTEGAIQWKNHLFQSTDTGDTTTWEARFSQKKASEVAIPPAGWTPDKTFVKRRIHLTEPPGETDYPNMRVFVEKNVIEIDEGENGTLTNDNTLEVRADSFGKLEVGPISLNVLIENAQQVVEVELQAFSDPDFKVPRGGVVRFIWKFDNQEELRYWEIFTGDQGFLTRYKYRVHVIVMGSIFSQGKAWFGPWVEAKGNGPIMITVPTPDDREVTHRTLTSKEIFSFEIEHRTPREITLAAVRPPETPPVAVGTTGHPPTSAVTAEPPPTSPYRASPPPKEAAPREKDEIKVKGYDITPPPSAQEVITKRGRDIPVEEEVKFEADTKGWYSKKPS